MGHLDLLMAEGLAREIDDGEVIRFVASGENG
jgi:hypothetical protein